MKYYVQVPLNRDLRFPDSCPFSDKPSPKSTVRLKATSTSLVLPAPHGIHNEYQTTTLPIPASRETALVASVLGAGIWLSLLGGMTLCVLLLNLRENKGTLAAGALLGGPILAAAFRFARYLYLRKVRIKTAWNGFVEVRFDSEDYARAFSDLNRLALDAR